MESQMTKYGPCLFKQGVKGRQFATCAVVLKHAAQQHDPGLQDVGLHQLVYHILAED